MNDNDTVPTEMTTARFKDAMAALIDVHHGSITGERSVDEIRVWMAAAVIIKQRRAIPDGRDFRPTPEEVVDFLTGLDRLRRRALKVIANGMTRWERTRSTNDERDPSPTLFHSFLGCAIGEIPVCYQ
jgi:hypothetical protein